MQGQVWIKILVSESGDIESAEVVSGEPVLARSALDAVKKWKFKPFIKNGKPVKVSTKLPFDFAFSDKVMTNGVSADSSTRTDPPKTSPLPPPSSAVSGTPTGDVAPKTVQVSPGVTTGMLIHQIAPVYPPDARRANIQGVIVLQALISKEGRITELKRITGPKELAGAAIDAVEQWRYRPYLLNGEPVAVRTQIQVNFTLNR